MEKDYYQKLSEDFRKGYEWAEKEYIEVIKEDNNLKAFVEGYKQGYKDGIKAANKALEKQMQNISMDEEGVHPLWFPRWP